MCVCIHPHVSAWWPEFDIRHLSQFLSILLLGMGIFHQTRSSSILIDCLAMSPWDPLALELQIHTDILYGFSETEIRAHVYAANMVLTESFPSLFSSQFYRLQIGRLKCNHLHSLMHLAHVLLSATGILDPCPKTGTIPCAIVNVWVD